jgi:ABC-type transport system involved in multi-copper enzyme maturation permease subunit
MAVREIWWGSVGSRRGIRGAGLLMLGASLVLWFAAETLGGSATDALGAAVVLHGVMAVVFTAGAAAGVFTKEHEQRGMDMLRITLLTPSEVVRGKYVAGLRFAFIVSFLSVPANALLYYRVLSDGDPIGFFLAGQGTVIVCALLAASLAMAVSVLAKRTATAVVGGFLAVAAALFGAPLLLWSIAVSLDSGRVWALEFLLGVSSPVVGFFYLAEEYGRQPGVGIDWRFPLLWSLNCFEFLVVAFGAYVFASNCYARLRAQDR